MNPTFVNLAPRLPWHLTNLVNILPVTKPEDVTFDNQSNTSGLSILTKIPGKRLPSQLVMDPWTTPSWWYLMPSLKSVGPPESPLQVPASVPTLLAQKIDPPLNLLGRASSISQKYLVDRPTVYFWLQWGIGLTVRSIEVNISSSSSWGPYPKTFMPRNWRWLALLLDFFGRHIGQTLGLSFWKKKIYNELCHAVVWIFSSLSV